MSEHQLGKRCPGTQRIQATVHVLRCCDGRHVKTFRTARSGRFRTTLPPGRYLLRPHKMDALRPLASLAIVRAKHFTTVHLRYETKIQSRYLR
jgi:hypothetical protein